MSTACLDVANLRGEDGKQTLGGLGNNLLSGSLFPLSNSPLYPYTFAVTSSLIFIPFVSNAMVFSKYFPLCDSVFPPPSSLSLSTYSPSCSTLTYAWSTSGEVQVFLIPLLCFSLYKGSKFEQLLHGIQSCKGNFKIRLNGSGRWGLVEGIYCSLLLQWYLRVEQRRETPIFYYVHFTCQNRKTTGLINNINRGSVALIVPVSHSSEPACIIGPFHRRHFDLS